MSRRKKRPACGCGKACYSTRGRALRALELIRMDNAQAVAPLEFEPQSAYRCAAGVWHLTRQEGGAGPRG